MIITGLIVGLALGFVLQRGRFCVTGAFRDLTLTGNTRWFSALILLIAVHSIGLFLLNALGVISLEASPFPWLATIIGGLIFGFAIVLAGGCATGTYYRAGEGLVGSWFALIFYALTSAVMKLGPGASFTEGLRSITVESGTLQASTGLSPWVFVAILSAIAVWVTVRHNRKNTTPLATLPPLKTGLAHLLTEKRWNPFATAVVIGIIATIAWPLSAATGRNSGLGITTPSANLTGYLATGDASLVDWGVMLVIGILVGSFIAAKVSGEFRIRVPDQATVVKSIVGGVGMGVGAAIAGGCTVGNAMVSTAQFEYQGWVATFFMIVGAGVAAKFTIKSGPRTGVAQPAESKVV
ncbi:YeeE/YedE family protein [Brevibacterium sandarakinum]|uniref:YeeE/YedE family protein n=1 Tax=Brevibacterium sandarakinum TaxID=629680 RepID=UPI002652C042|nr:YeeE/YedE family protein [Brevibacterium sandarakinum]MDN5658686.1 YeeE/YedE family protein [Brevibacterium sandarakinum]